jgi:hypothetical protein
LNRLPASLGTPGQLEERTAVMAPADIDFASIYPGLGSNQSDDVLEAPFGYKPNRVGTYHSSTVDYGYYEGVENANTPRAVQRKIDELARHPDSKLLLPNRFEDLCRVNAGVQRHLITLFFFFPYTARAAHPISVHQPICDYIKGHYARVHPATEDNFEYELWSPNRSFLATK